MLFRKSLIELKTRFFSIEWMPESSRKRLWYVASFIETHKKATTYKSWTNSFQKCGIFPFNPDEPLSNPHFQNRGNTEESETQTRNRLYISGKLLTSDETFNEIIDYYVSKCCPNPFTYGYESLYNCFIK